LTLAYLVVAWTTAAATAFSGIAAMLRLSVIAPAMDRAGVPRSWLVFPIGVLKALGAGGLLLGLLAVPQLVPVSAAALVLFFTCAVHTHLLARDFSSTFALALAFLTLTAATLALHSAA
jgi:hypothetical protein